MTDAVASGTGSSPRARVVAAALGLGAGILTVTPVDWLRVATMAPVRQELGVPGSLVAPGAVAGGLLVLAGGVALALARRWGRLLAASGVILGSLLVLVVTIGVIVDPEAAAASQLSGAPGGPTALSPAPFVVSGLAVASLVVGALGMVVRWSVPARRYERAVVDADVWDRMSRGEDPTV